jgi:hypothetical protein
MKIAIMYALKHAAEEGGLSHAFLDLLVTSGVGSEVLTYIKGDPKEFQAARDSRKAEVVAEISWIAESFEPSRPPDYYVTLPDENVNRVNGSTDATDGLVTSCVCPEGRRLLVTPDADRTCVVPCVNGGGYHDLNMHRNTSDNSLIYSIYTSGVYYSVSTNSLTWQKIGHTNKAGEIPKAPSVSRHLEEDPSNPNARDIRQYILEEKCNNITAKLWHAAHWKPLGLPSYNANTTSVGPLLCDVVRSYDRGQSNDLSIEYYSLDLKYADKVADPSDTLYGRSNFLTTGMPSERDSSLSLQEVRYHKFAVWELPGAHGVTEHAKSVSTTVYVSTRVDDMFDKVLRCLRQLVSNGKLSEDVLLLLEKYAMVIRAHDRRNTYRFSDLENIKCFEVAHAIGVMKARLYSLNEETGCVYHNSVSLTDLCDSVLKVKDVKKMRRRLGSGAEIYSLLSAITLLGAVGQYQEQLLASARLLKELFPLYAELHAILPGPEDPKAARGDYFWADVMDRLKKLVLDTRQGIAYVDALWVLQRLDDLFAPMPALMETGDHDFESALVYLAAREFNISDTKSGVQGAIRALTSANIASVLAAMDAHIESTDSIFSAYTEMPRDVKRPLMLNTIAVGAYYEDVRLIGILPAVPLHDIVHAGMYFDKGAGSAYNSAYDLCLRDQHLRMNQLICNFVREAE